MLCFRTGILAETRMLWTWCLTSVTLCVMSIPASTAVETSDSSAHAGHLQPFGSSGPFHSVDVVDNFPSTAEFFRDYVLRSRPLKMTGAAQLSYAFHKWTDDYFLQTPVDANSQIAVETAKKENRSSPLLRLHFHEFLRLYNSTDQYMVDDIPQEFRYRLILNAFCARIIPNRFGVCILDN